MMARPGYPKITSTPPSTSVRQRIWAPVSISVIDSHSPEVDGVERPVLELVGVARLIDGVQHRAGTRLDDVRGGAVARERLARDAHRHQHLAEAVAARGDGLDREVQHFDAALDHGAHARQRDRDSALAAGR